MPTSIMFPLIGFLNMLLLIIVTESTWLSPTSTLPREDYGFAVGAYNNKIFIVGGVINQKQLVEYEISTDTFIDYGTNALNISDMYTIDTQNSEILYMILDNYNYSTYLGESVFATFNMITKEYTEKWKGITMNTYVSTYACLASSDEYLYVIGGSDHGVYINTSQILSLSTYEWVNNAPSMNDDRTEHACVVSNDYLWAFAGWGGVNGWELKSNERIHISNISQNTWQYTQDLSFALYGLSAVVTKEGIYVIGGLRQSGYTRQDIVHIVDPDTGAVTVSSDRLSYGVSHFGVTVYNERICVFGGSISSAVYTNSWMYHQLPTTSPTYNPTHNPTFNPSSVTKDPSREPSVFPTLFPTLPPTIPSALPTSDPLTLYPSKHPTISPHTSNPTIPSSLATIAGNTESIHKSDGTELKSSPDLLSIILVICTAVLCTFIVVVSVLFMNECRKNKRNNRQLVKAFQQKRIQAKKEEVADGDVCDKIASMKHDDSGMQLGTVTKGTTDTIADDHDNVGFVAADNATTKGEGYEGVEVPYDIGNDEFEVICEDETTAGVTYREN